METNGVVVLVAIVLVIGVLLWLCGRNTQHPKDCMCNPCQIYYIEQRRKLYAEKKRAKERAAFERTTEAHLKNEYGVELGGTKTTVERPHHHTKFCTCFDCATKVHYPQLWSKR